MIKKEVVQVRTCRKTNFTMLRQHVIHITIDRPWDYNRIRPMCPKAYLNNSIASNITFGARNPSPEIPLAQLILIVLLPLTNVPAGMA